eukprot:GFUD01029767.1.p1 GENE.GFUD01029767.1~~GFUD01029767.1.p1  ORF type:complete len:1184 (-),score=323.29 GFUD01029767.1:921-4472(-)
MDLTDDASHPTPPQDLDIQSLLLDPLALKADQTPTPSLEPPLRDSAPSNHSILGSPSKTRPSSVIATKNTRKRMEDRHVVLHDLKAYLPSALQNKIDPLEHVSYYAVFDGHAGTDAAAYAAAHLHELLVESQAYPADPVQAFKEAFTTCDKDFVATSKKSGSTAVCALIKGGLLYVAWLGDSQATLVRGGVPIKIVASHKPNRDDERARIEALGGAIMHFGTWRVNGQLAVSRAIGDGEYKPYVSAEPDVTTVVLNGSDEFLIVGCDGLWDTVTPEEATEIVFNHLEEKRAEAGDIGDICARLATKAKEKGSGDNITIIVVFLKSVEEVISLGKLSNRASGSAEADISGITTTSDYVFSSGGRDSLEPSKEKPDFTSPNVSFANPEGGAMFSPDPFGHVGNLGNGFNMSSESFDNNIEDKRFSNEADRVSDGAFNNDHMAEMLKKQSIDKVDDLLKMLDREDSSPTPDNEDARPLEEILAAAREQPEDHVDGVEDDPDSSDDEIVELRNGRKSSNSSGNSQLEEVLKLDDRKLSDDLVYDVSPSTPSNGLPVFPEPTMDPCEQVTVEATGPVEYGTVVPPTQELPTHQQPVLEIVDTMTCSMVVEKEENPDQEGSNGVESNGVGENISFEGGDGEEGFMLKTPGEEEQQLAEFTLEVERERETSVDTGESVEEQQVAAPVHPTSLSFSEPSDPSGSSSGGLGVPDVQITPATPTRARSPQQAEEKEITSETVTESVPVEVVVPSITTTEPTPDKPKSSKPETAKGPAVGGKTTSATKPSTGKPTGKPGPPPISKAAATQGKSTTAKSAVGPTAKSAVSSTAKSAVGSTAKPGAAKPTTTTAPKSAGSRPTSSTVGARPKTTETTKPVGAASRMAKPTKTTTDTKPTEAIKRPTKPVTPTARPTERKPLATKSAENGSTKSAENGTSKPTTKPAVPRTIPSKPKPTDSKAAETKSDPPKRPTSSTAPRPPAAKSSGSSRPTVSRQPSNASSSSSAARPRPAVPKATTATTNRVGSGAAKTPAAPRPATTTTKPGPGLSRSGSSATTRPTASATAGRAATSTAVKPTPAAARVAAARAAAKAQKPGAVKAKVPSTAGSPSTAKKSGEKTENKTQNGDTTGTNGGTPDIVDDNPVESGNNEPAEEVLETINKNVVTGEETEAGEQVTEEDRPHLNGGSEIGQSTEC